METLENLEGLDNLGIWGFRENGMENNGDLQNLERLEFRNFRIYREFRQSTEFKGPPE